jgi:tetratricopeptide (TPR) repeat protein
MTSVFIVRPFGKKPGAIKGKDGKDASVEVDFDEVDRSLIKAALAKNSLIGQTTGVIAQAGNIRVDMFQMLIAYDLVIADISIDNANVFFELGIRHGLRPNGTILICFKGGRDTPFDLKTDRYIEYDREKPADAVDLLAQSIKDTILAMRSRDSRPDSPVFLLLPELVPPDPARLIVVPKEFQEAVEKAEGDAARGRTTLALLAEEAKLTPWGREGIRLIARAQRRIRHFEAALESWEYIRKDLPNDVEANLQLATIFQRLGDLVSASQACRRVLDNPAADRRWRADARSQLARNEKASWVADFSVEANEEERRAQAISDARMTEAFEGYMAGFAEDLNDYYSGINALGLLTAIVKLAEMEPDAWASSYETERKASAALDDYREQLDYVRGAVRISLDNAAHQAQRTGKPDEWLPPSDAQYALLTADKPGFVKNAYKAAKIAGRTGFSVDSEAAQVGIFKALGLLPENCSAALEALGVSATTSGLSSAAPSTATPSRDRVIVGTGHRVDAPNRGSPRFPNSPECIDKAKRWLREMVQAEKAGTAGSPIGIAGAASGVDLLFHEVCGELGVPTTVVLPIPKEEYRRQSVADGGPDWVERFNRLVDSKQPIILSESASLPPWAESIADYSVFQRGNIWMIEDALLRPDANVTLLALWNGKAGDGPGGTQDMVKLAETHGAKICRENTDDLFGLPR